MSPPSQPVYTIKCGWSQAHLGGPLPGEAAVSHGICSTCAAELLGELEAAKRSGEKAGA
jgi:hypothetical protein